MVKKQTKAIYNAMNKLICATTIKLFSFRYSTCSACSSSIQLDTNKQCSYFVFLECQQLDASRLSKHRTTSLIQRQHSHSAAAVAAAVATLITFTYETSLCDYVHNWQQISCIMSKEQAEQGT